MPTAIMLPPTYAMHAALARLSSDAQQRGDVDSMRAYDKAAADLALGRFPLISDDCWLMMSASRGGLVHRVRQLGGVWSCNCEHGLKKGGLCRHLALAEGIREAWEDVADTDADSHPAMVRLHAELAEAEATLYPADGRDAYERAQAEIDELYC